MNIEKVSNGYVVEVAIELHKSTASAMIQCGTKKTICPDLIQLLNFINAYYGNDEAKSVVMKDVITKEDVIRNASPTAMVNDITGYLADIGVVLAATKINIIRIKCDYWFRIAQLNGAR